MHQKRGWGEPFERVASDRLYHLHWEIGYRDHVYDIWVDDVRLVGCGSDAPAAAPAASGATAPGP